MKRIFVLILFIVILVFIQSTQYKEQFMDVPCEDYDTCVSCANKSSCTWCSSSKKCLTKSEIGRTDALCSPINLVHTAPMCHVEEQVESNRDMQGNPLIQDRTAPPMVYMNPNMEYSPETVMANMNNIRHELQLLRQGT